ncbi:NACHT domain-containing protein [Amycolatopsis sp. NPDC059021]|uniref:NACHT domain-containing protein n=1 Tax=Amycolatopsis sp. NPDC059021 TaxID=3346704 RepID=UPI003670A81D
MRNRNRARIRKRNWVFACGALVFCGLIGWAFHADATGRGQFAVALIALAFGTVVPTVTVFDRMTKAAEDPDTAELDRLAAKVARAATNESRRSARSRGLQRPPLSVRWQLFAEPGAGRDSEALLNRDGDYRDLYKIYERLGDRRLIIVGEPGAGKSSAAILLLLDVLEHGNKANPDDVRKIPVPVILTMRGWRSTTQLEEWLIGKITELPRVGNLSRRQAAALLENDRIAVFLDGLDEMPENHRSAALEALDETTFRLVLLSRTGELKEAAENGVLRNAIALELQPLEAEVVAAYLRAYIQDPLRPVPTAWKKVIAKVEKHPRSRLAQALDTPLNVAFLLDVYHLGDPVDELLDGKTFRKPEDIRNHLFGKATTLVCEARPGGYAPETVRTALTTLARRLKQDGAHDLDWWRLPDWVPNTPRIVLNAVLGAALGGVFGLLWGLHVPGRARNHVRIPGPAVRLARGRARLRPGVRDHRGGLVIAAFGGRKHARRPPRVWRHLVSPQLPEFKLTVALVAGTAAGVPPGGDLGLAGGTLVGVAVALAAGLAAHFTTTDTAGPADAWWTDLSSSLKTGLVFGVVVGLATGTAMVLLRSANTGWFLFGPVLGIPLGIAAGLANSRVWAAAVAQLYLAARDGTPLRLVRFLGEVEAHRPYLLRIAARSYQFRHANLRDWLAAQDRKGATPPAARPGK